jgi:hypothetical protein
MALFRPTYGMIILSLPLRLIRECISSCRSILYVPDKDNLTTIHKE